MFFFSFQDRERQASSQQTKLPPYIPAPPYRHPPERTPSCSSGDHSHANSPRSFSNSPQTFLNSPRTHSNSHSNSPRAYTDSPRNCSDPAHEKLINSDTANGSSSNLLRDSENWTPNRSQSQQSLCPRWRQSQNYDADPSMFRSPERPHGASFQGTPSSRSERERSNSRTKEDHPNSSVFVKSGVCGEINSNYSTERRNETFSRTNCDLDRTYDSLREHNMHEGQRNPNSYSTPKRNSSDSHLKERRKSTEYDSQAAYDPHLHSNPHLHGDSHLHIDPHLHVDPGESAYPVMTRYEDVEMFKSDPSSQVSSSTDSGYGHHLYEKLGNYSQRTGENMEISPYFILTLIKDFVSNQSLEKSNVL